MKIIQHNKKVYHEYFILESKEAGIVLKGTEVKSLRENRLNITEAFCKFTNNELFLVGAQISTYSHAKFFNHEPDRERKLLLKKRELRQWKSKVMEKGLTIVPIKIYFNDEGLVKAEIALVKGKHLYDKREDLKKKDIQREIEKNLKR
jgi:SsrA-binding protein